MSIAKEKIQLCNARFLNLKLLNVITMQESMTCTFPTDAVPCSEAASLYNLNSNFGVIPEKKAT